MNAKLLGFALLAGLAGGYLFRKWVGEWKPSADAPTDRGPQEWEPGVYAGFDTVYRVRRPDVD